MSLEIGARRFVFAWVACCGLILLLQRFRTPTTISLEIAVREAPKVSATVPCFFYNTGNGFSEGERACFEYDRKSPKEFHTYQVALPTFKPIRQLRFDPMWQPGIVAIRHIRIGRYRSIELDPVRELGQTIYSLNQAEFTLTGDTLVVRFSSNDPSFVLADRIDRLTGLEAGVVLRAAAIAFLLCATAIVLNGLLRSVLAGNRW